MPVAAYGTPSAAPLAMPLRYGPIGSVSCSLARAGRESRSPAADLRLLEDVARQLSTATHAVDARRRPAALPRAPGHRARRRTPSAPPRPARRARPHPGRPRPEGQLDQRAGAQPTRPAPATWRTRCTRRSGPPSPTSAVSSTACGRRPWTSSAWSARSARPGARQPGRARADRHRRRRPDRPARRRRGRRLPDRRRGADQRAPPRRGPQLHDRPAPGATRSSWRSPTTAPASRPTIRPGSACSRCASAQPNSVAPFTSTASPATAPA